MSGPPAIVPAEISQTSAESTSKAMPNGDQKNLPKLPIPKLEDTCKRYLRALEGLQDPDEHEKTKTIVQKFLTGGEGEKWQKRLIEYNEGVDSYIEEFWCEWSIGPADAALTNRRELPVPLRLGRPQSEPLLCAFVSPPRPG